MASLSLAAHIVASLFLFPTGLRRLRRSSTVYLHDPSHFRSKPWFFSDPPNWTKNLDLYLLLLALPIVSFTQFLKSASLHHSAAIFLFWALLVLVFLRENADPFLVSESLVFVFAGIAFLAEYAAIGGDGYGWLGELTLLCGGSCLYLSVRPTAFFAEFLLCSGLVLKGTWVLQTGLSLYTDAFGLRGCDGLSCDLEEDGLRAVAVMGFVFMVHVIVVLSLNLVVFGLCSRSGEAGGSLLGQLDSESLLVPATASDV